MGKHRIIALCAMAALAGGAAAKVPQAEADKLCRELTCVGADPKPNEDGTIPQWVGAPMFTDQQRTLTVAKLNALTPEGSDKILGTWATDQPQFVITRDNLAQYAARLTDGHKALFAMYPGYSMPVFESKRTVFYPEAVLKASRENATTATLHGTDSVKGARLGFPFPIPANGAEVMWNTKMRYIADCVRRYNNQAIVEQNGSFTITKLIEDVKFKYANLRQPGRSEDGVLLYYFSETLSPPKEEGQLLLVHETSDQSTDIRKAWIYNAGQRRVRRAPNVSYDNPSMGTDGQQTNDQINMFNGALDRYTWKLVGKKEFYVPYNSFKLNSRRLKYTDIIRKGHINQKHTRYELHRVWVVEAALKPGLRHIFKTRRFYVDEDSWSIAAVDLYDNRDKLWKFQEGHLITVPWVGAATAVPEIVYDLQTGRYFLTALTNEDKVNNTEIEFPDSYFTTQEMVKRARK